ncbi:phosphodiesterase [Sphingomonas adhaesiva]|uniref:phosphodiesterase n=1 Tax=Sphingomonas adhaesiva TaxID=28212 RepID=UPI002FF958F4
MTHASPARPLLIAQLTDLHLGFERDRADEPNRLRLDKVVAAIGALDPAPDLIVVSGDLVEHGDAASYARVREALAPLRAPVRLMLGNHDARAAFAAAFADVPLSDGFLHHVVEEAGLRCILLDTLEEGRHGGAFCATRAAWLSARLAEAPDAPTLIFLHHPPCVTGIPWMDVDPAEPWLERLRGALAAGRNVVGLVSGHLHRAIAARWAGLPVTVAPSVAPRVALELGPIDPDKPDGRRLIVDGTPGYALHRWDGEALVSHFVLIDDAPAVAFYDEKLRGMIAEMAAERPGGR